MMSSASNILAKTGDGVTLWNLAQDFRRTDAELLHSASQGQSQPRLQLEPHCRHFGI